LRPGDGMNARRKCVNGIPGNMSKKATKSRRFSLAKGRRRK